MDSDFITDLTLMLVGVTLDFCEVAADDQWWVLGIRMIVGYLINVVELSVSFIANNNLYNNQSLVSNPDSCNPEECEIVIISTYCIVLLLLLVSLIFTIGKYGNTRSCCGSRCILSIIFKIVSLWVSAWLYLNGSYLRRVDRLSLTNKFFFAYGLTDMMFTFGGILLTILFKIIKIICCCQHIECTKRKKICCWAIIFLIEIVLTCVIAF